MKTAKRIAEDYEDRSGLDPYYQPSCDTLKTALSIVDSYIHLMEKFPQQPDEIEAIFTYFNHIAQKRILKKPDQYSSKPYWGGDLTDGTALRLRMSLTAPLIHRDALPINVYDLGILRDKINDAIENTSKSNFQLISFKAVLERRKKEI